MPRDPMGRSEEEPPNGTTPERRGVAGSRRRSIRVDLSPQAVDALAPWIDVAEVGGVGLSRWLVTIAPLLPPSGAPRTGRPPSTEPGERLAELARALADCSSDQATAHFEAARYFADNQVLARRVRALEAAARTRAIARGDPVRIPEDRSSERAVLRYLPGEAGH